jgi:hypothetical protein
MNDEDQFMWIAHECTDDLNMSEEERRKWADFIEALAGELNLTPGQLMAELQKHSPEPEKEDDGSDWWKGK